MDYGRIVGKNGIILMMCKVIAILLSEGKMEAKNTP